MYKLISWYNQNRRMFWVTILAIFIISLIVWRLIYMWTDNSDSIISERTPQKSTNNTTDYNSLTISDNRSVISGENKDINKDEMSVIDNFISYCNSKKLKEAYDLLSKECKDEMYPELKNFEELYYKPVFGQGSRIASVENWTGDTYKVDLKQDALITGRQSTDNNLQDYITIVKDEDGNIKLNINNYIGRKSFDIKEMTEAIDIRLLEVNTYMDYETYTFEVANMLDESISLGDIEDVELSFLLDENSNKYMARNSELSQTGITVSKGQKKNIKIKYFNTFSSTRKITSIVFPRIILDYAEYLKCKDVEEYAYNPDYIEIQINL